MSVEAVMLWNEPNNLSHWDFNVDAEWAIFAGMVKRASRAIRRERPNLTQCSAASRRSIPGSSRT